MTNGGTSDNLMIVDGADEYNIVVGTPVYSIVYLRYLVALPGSAVECVLGC